MVWSSLKFGMEFIYLWVEQLFLYISLIDESWYILMFMMNYDYRQITFSNSILSILCHSTLKSL